MTNLIKTNDELQRYLPVEYTNEFDRVAPFIAAAERQYIRSLIGKAQYEVFSSTYEAAGTVDNIADPELKTAIKYCQNIITNLGYLLAIPSLSLVIGASGFQVRSNSDTKQAFKWQMDELKMSLLELGFSAIEDLLIHLEESPDKFPEYIDSDQHRRNEDFLIQTAAQFTEHFNINGSRYTFSTIAYIMKRIEVQTVAKLFGSNFVQSLKSGEIEGKQLELVNEYLAPGIALLTGAKAIIERVITLKNGIAAVNLQGNFETEKNSLPATKEQTKEAYDQLTADGSRFLEDGMNFILDNIEDFPGYVQPVARRRFKVKNDKTKGVYIP